MTLQMIDLVETNQWVRVENKLDTGLDRVQLHTKKMTYVTYSRLPQLLLEQEPWYYLLIQQSSYVIGEYEYRQIHAWLEEREVIKEMFRPRKMSCWSFSQLTESQMFEFRVRWL
jgi:hypothetical protein